VPALLKKLVVGQGRVETAAAQLRWLDQSKLPLKRVLTYKSSMKYGASRKTNPFASTARLARLYFFG
jgi:hypothetical protein